MDKRDSDEEMRRTIADAILSHPARNMTKEEFDRDWDSYWNEMHPKQKGSWIIDNWLFIMIAILIVCCLVFGR